MIFYFSATGNSLYTAQRLAAATGESLCSITACMQSGQLDFTISKDEMLGFVHPTFFYGLPKIVLEFIRKAQFHVDAQPYVFHVLTMGGSSGGAGDMFRREMAAKGIQTSASFAVVLPDTWTPMFDLSNTAKNLRIVEAAEPVIDDIIAKVTAHTAGDFDKRKGFWRIFSKATYAAYQKQNTSKFFVSDACVGCGKCAEQCPDKAIEMQNGKPVWLHPHCNFCLGCLHQCPAFAIQFGNNTKKHGQWFHPKCK